MIEPDPTPEEPHSPLLKGFVSYAEFDIALVDRFLDLLRPRLDSAAGFRVDAWFARRHLATGHRWQEEIDRAMTRATSACSSCHLRSWSATTSAPRNCPTSSTATTPSSLPVGLETVNLQTANLKGLEQHQIHRLRQKGKPQRQWFSECGGMNLKRFCDQLVQDMTTRFDENGLLG
jgi:hypothetical protein